MPGRGSRFGVSAHGKAPANLQEQQQKDHHTHQEIVGMYHRKGSFAGEGVQLGEFPVEYPARHGENRIEQGTVHIAFH